MLSVDEEACNDRRGSSISLKSDRKTTASFESEHCSQESPDVRRQEERLMLQAMIGTQANNRYFNQNAPHIKYRETVVRWLIDTVRKLNYKQSTMHSAIAFFDAISSLSLVNLEQVKLVAFVCMYLAAKIEQKHGDIPTIADCLSLFENQFSRKDFETCEALVFKMLKYRLNIVTPFHFLSFFLTQELLFEEDFDCGGLVDQAKLSKRFAKECLQLLEKSLLDYDFYRYTSLAVSAGIIAAVRNRFNLKAAWNKSLEELTLVSYDSIGSCMFTLLEIFDHEPKKTKGVSRVEKLPTEIAN